MNVDRICQYIESKLPRSTWEFHGPDIRRFIEKEMVESAVVPVDFKQLSKVNPESMREVVGVDTTGVISDVREFECALPAEEVASMYRWRSGDDHPSDDRIVMARFNGDEVKAFYFRLPEMWYEMRIAGRWYVMRAGEWIGIESPVTEWRELTEGKPTWGDIKRAKKDSTPCVGWF